MEIKLAKVKQPNSVGVVTIILVIMFFALMGGIAASIAFSQFDTIPFSIPNLISVIYFNGLPIAFSALFLILAIYFLFLCICPPKKYQGKLLRTNETTIDNDTYSRLVFNIHQFNLSREVSCIVPLGTPVNVGSFYLLKVKDLNAKICSIQPLSSNLHDSNKNKNSINKFYLFILLLLIIALIVVATQLIYFAFDRSIFSIILGCFILFGLLIATFETTTALFSEP